MKALKEGAVVNGAAVVQSEANRYAAEVAIPDIKRSIRETENAIDILVGRPSGALNRTKLDEQKTIDSLQTGIPSQLLKTGQMCNRQNMLSTVHLKTQIWHTPIFIHR